MWTLTSFISLPFLWQGSQPKIPATRSPKTTKHDSEIVWVLDVSCSSASLSPIRPHFRCFLSFLGCPQAPLLWPRASLLPHKPVGSHIHGPMAEPAGCAPQRPRCHRAPPAVPSWDPQVQQTPGPHPNNNAHGKQQEGPGVPNTWPKCFFILCYFFEQTEPKKWQNVHVLHLSTQICLGQKLMNDICWTRTKEGIGPSKAGLPLPQWDPAYILLFLLDSSPLSIDSCQASRAQLLAQRSQERLAIGLVPKNKDLPGVSVLPASCSPPASHRISGECFPEITPAKTPNRMCQHRTFYIQ